MQSIGTFSLYFFIAIILNCFSYLLFIIVESHKEGSISFYQILAKLDIHVAIDNGAA